MLAYRNEDQVLAEHDRWIVNTARRLARRRHATDYDPADLAQEGRLAMLSALADLPFRRLQSRQALRDAASHRMDAAGANRTFTGHDRPADGAAYRPDASLESLTEDDGQSVRPVSRDRNTESGPLTDALASLPADLRTVAELRFMDAWSVPDIANAVGLSRRGVQARMVRVITALRATPEVALIELERGV